MNKFWIVMGIPALGTPVVNMAYLSGYVKMSLDEAKQYAAQCARTSSASRWVVLESIGDFGTPVLPVNFQPHKGTGEACCDKK